MMKLRTAIIGTFLLITSITSCNKVEVENIPYLLELANDNVEVSYAESIEIDVLDNDIIDGDNISVSILNQPEHGKLSLLNNSTIYEYSHNGNGTSNKDVFTYQVCINNNCKEAQVDINIVDIIIPNSCTAYAGKDYYFYESDYLHMPKNGLLENDVTPCSSWNLSSLKIVKSPEYGVIEVEYDQLVYRPYNTYWEKDEIKYEICDGLNQCKTAIIKITNNNIQIPIQQ